VGYIRDGDDVELLLHIVKFQLFLLNQPIFPQSRPILRISLFHIYLYTYNTHGYYSFWLNKIFLMIVFRLLITVSLFIYTYFIYTVN